MQSFTEVLFANLPSFVSPISQESEICPGEPNGCFLEDSHSWKLALERRLHAELRIEKEAMYNYAQFKVGDPCVIMEQMALILLEYDAHCIEHNEQVESFIGYTKTAKYCAEQQKKEASEEEKALREYEAEMERQRKAEESELEK